MEVFLKGNFATFSRKRSPAMPSRGFPLASDIGANPSWWISVTELLLIPRNLAQDIRVRINLNLNPRRFAHL